ncbi:MAG: hypothetical protein FT714_19110 [Pantoea sp. Pent]|nr:hypothetical protein [Pantoea sp. Pent]
MDILFNTGDDNKPKKIIIALSCNFALTGLQELCRSLPGCEVQTILGAPEAISDELMFSYADLVITDRPRDAAGLAELLLIPEWFKGSTLILLDEEAKAMRRTLLDADFSDVVMKKEKLTTLHQVIHNLLQANPESIEEQLIGKNALIREKRVICALLRGVKPSLIAREMGLHPREINRSKIN